LARHNKNWQDGNYAVVLDEKLVRMLTQLEKNKEKASNKALREGAKVMAGHVEKHTPVGPEPRKPDKYGPYTPYSMTRLRMMLSTKKLMIHISLAMVKTLTGEQCLSTMVRYTLDLKDFLRKLLRVALKIL